MAARPLRATPVVGGLVRAYEERLTARGRVLLGAVAALAVMGLDTRRSHVYVVFAAGASALLLGLALAVLRRRPRVELDCALPARATAGAPLALRVRVKSRRGPLGDLRLHFPRPVRWGASLRFEPREQFLAAEAGEATEATTVLTPLRRGEYVLRGPTLRGTDPLRLAAGPAAALADQRLLVYPRFYRLDAFEIPLGRRYQPGGIPLSSSTGDAVEFVGTREYRAGDPVKNIHWRSWARRGEPVVKEHQEEYFCRIALVLDTFLPRRARPEQVLAFEGAITVLASIADCFSRSEHIVDILAAGPEVYEVSAGRSLAYLDNILDVLACLEPCHDPPFATIGPHLFEKLTRITAVVAILQDWDPARRALLRRVREQGTAVRVIIVREGPTSEAWEGEVEELGEVRLMTPADVERALAGGAARTAAEAPRA